MSSTIQRALLTLKAHIDSDMPGAYFGGDDPESPSLVLPMPAGYEGWVNFADNQYIAFFCHAQRFQQVWYREVGERLAHLGQVWANTRAFYTERLNAEGAPLQPAPSFTPRARDPYLTRFKPGRPDMALDTSRFPQTPEKSLFEDMRTLLSTMARDASPEVTVDHDGPQMLLATLDSEIMAFLPSFNSLVVMIIAARDDGSMHLVEEPYTVSCEFVHDPIAGALIILAEYLERLGALIGDPSLSLRTRADLEDESVGVREMGTSTFNRFAELVHHESPTDRQKWALWSIEPLRKVFSGTL